MRYLFLAAIFTLFACAPKPVVAIKPGYDYAKVGRVALLDFEDAPQAPGSGQVVSQSMEPYLIRAGYELIERGQIEKILNEQAFSHAAEADPGTAVKMGKVLGVDAVILGRITSLDAPRSDTYVHSVDETNYQPVYRTAVRTDRRGNERARTELDHYDVVSRTYQVPYTVTTDAKLSFSARLVDVTTGAVLWTGSVSSEGASVTEAANEAAQRLLDALKPAWPARRG
jgi:hypothetical protein